MVNGFKLPGVIDNFLDGFCFEIRLYIESSLDLQQKLIIDLWLNVGKVLSIKILYDVFSFNIIDPKVRSLKNVQLSTEKFKRRKVKIHFRKAF